MPEGDTIYKIAAYMQPRLAGQTLIRAEAAHSRLPVLEGQTVAQVSAAGKHLLVHVGSWLLRVHLGMHGSWHRYAHGERWQKPLFQALVVLATNQEVFVCFNPLDVECLQTHERRVSPLGALGPDLLETSCDMQEVLRRARAMPSQTFLTDLLLNQRVAAGVGNVFKCELLFMQRLHPLAQHVTLTDSQLSELYALARTQLQNNLGGWPRTTTYDARQGPRESARLYVYKRAGAPCTHCNATVQRATLGVTRRVTYWCPNCQSL